MFNDKDIKALAYEKAIDVDRVYKALEDALATAARKYYKTREPLEAVLNLSNVGGHVDEILAQDSYLALDGAIGGGRFCSNAPGFLV